MIMLSSSNSTRIKKRTACGCILIYIVYFKPSSPIHGGVGGMCLRCGEVALIKIKNRISLMQDMLRLAQNTEKTDT